MDRETTCCFTGHRPDKLPGGFHADPMMTRPLREALYQAIDDAISDGYRTFLCGMAQGVDTWAAEEIVRRRQNDPSLCLIAALPCPGQDSRWPYAVRQHYRALLQQVDDRYMACNCYTPYCMNGRNLWMVEHASRLIAVYDGSSGGTAHTVRLAEDHALTIVRIDPRNFIR